MKTFFSYIWSVIADLAVLCIAIYILNSASSRFETNVYAILILIYLAISSNRVLNVFAMLKQASSSDEQFKYLRKLLKGKQCEGEEEMEKVADSNIRHLYIKGYISGIISGIIFIIALIKIISF